jgi:flavodoxin
MGKALVAYVSVTGFTQKTAELIAEGLRFSGHQAEVKKVSELKEVSDIEGYDGYVFGCPTYHRDMTQNMKTFLFLARKAGLEGKVGGAFGTYTHSGDAPGMILDTMEHVYKMKVVSAGSMNLKEDLVDTPDGMKAGQDYGRAIGEAMGS